MDAKIFGRNLKIILDAKSIKQIDLARAAGVERSYITEIIKGAKTPSSKVINKLGGPLDLTSNEILKLYDPDINPLDLISHKPPSIIIPIIFKFSTLTQTIVDDLRSMNISKHSSSYKFISFPMCEPFNIMQGRRIICIIVDNNTGMSPVISPNDMVFVDVLERSTKEGQIYLCKNNTSLKFRYAMESEFKGSRIIRMWPEERKYSVEMVDFQDSPESPILGLVTTVTRRFGI